MKLIKNKKVFGHDKRKTMPYLGIFKICDGVVLQKQIAVFGR